MLRTQKILSLSVGALLATCATMNALADTTATQSQSVGLTNTNFSTNFVFTKFDTTLGTLQSITIDLTGSAVSNASVSAVSSAGNYEFDSQTVSTLSRPLAGGQLVQVLPFNPEFQHLGSAGDPSLPYTYPTNNASATSPATVFSSSSDLTLFSGAGTISLPFDVRGSSGVSGPGTVTSTVSTQGSGAATLFYTYSPNVTASTPEPGTWAMLGAGASGCLLALRRRRKK